jgi:hypothetical protein
MTGSRFRRRQSEEFTLPHADHGAIFGETIFHGGDDLIGERDLRIYQRSFLAVPLIRLPGNGGVRSLANGALSLRAISKEGKRGPTHEGLSPITSQTQPAKACGRPDN